MFSPSLAKHVLDYLQTQQTCVGQVPRISPRSQSSARKNSASLATT